MGNITFKEGVILKDINAEYEKQKREAEQRQKEEELRIIAEWEALINKPQTFQKEGENNGK
jgi:hypothetical protein